ncbi:hypothetical protein ACQ4PT_019295 [Festuca glaucescens]
MPSIDNANDNGEIKPPHQQLVCVTGAGGFIGSWVVKELLLRGYRVRGTARDPADSKNAHLLALEGAEKLTLCRANLLNYDSLRAAFTGCHGVFHVASPVSNDPELVPVAVEGTRNVISAAADAGVRRIVFTSSYGAVHMDPNRSPDAVLDETCWSDYEYCKQSGVSSPVLLWRISTKFPPCGTNVSVQSLSTKNLYACAEPVLLCEDDGRDHRHGGGGQEGLEMAVVVPSMTMGPMLQQSLNFSSSHVARYLTGAKPTYPNAVAAYTDVRDVARAHVLAYERPDARGRYLCIGAVLHRAHFLNLLKNLFPQYSFTAKCEDDGKPMAKPYKFSNQRLRDLGLKFTPLAESLYETVTCLQKNGHLPLPAPVAPKRAYL